MCLFMGTSTKNIQQKRIVFVSDKKFYNLDENEIEVVNKNKYK